jgi:rhodanese-related sulfurtransferase|tara:strand:+ start:601 stop:1683 length:1083 start_codon:yes stop_codon:yes gene_type:complete
MALAIATTLRATTLRDNPPACPQNAFRWRVQSALAAKVNRRARVSRRPPTVPRASGDAAAAVADVDDILPAFGPGSSEWPVIHADLRSGKFGTVKLVTSEQAVAMMRDAANPAALADVRPRIEFAEFAAEDTNEPLDVRNVPYFVPHRSVAKRWQGKYFPFTTFRRLIAHTRLTFLFTFSPGYFLCTKDGLKERDPGFTSSFARKFPDRHAPIVVACKTGGDLSLAPVTVDPVTKRQVFPEGSSQYVDYSKSNSLMALYELQQAGYTNLFHLQGGVTNWCASGEPHRGDENAFYFHPTILPGILFQLIMVEGIVVRSNLAYVKKFHPENFELINQSNQAYGMINDLVQNSPINWMFDYYS